MTEPKHLAQRVHELWTAMIPESTSPWNELPHNVRTALSIGVESLLPAAAAADQLLEFERNRWQQHVGVLLNLIQGFVKSVPESEDDAREAAEDLLSSAIRAVNTNPYTKNIDDPHADVALMTTMDMLRKAIAAGLVVEGPNWPEKE